MASVYIGDPIPVVLQLGDRNTSAVVNARIFDASGSEIPDSPCGLAHFYDGLYIYGGAFMPDTPFISVQYIVYYGDGVTINETYPAVAEIFTMAVRGMSPPQEEMLREVHEIHGLAFGVDLVVTPTSRTAGSIAQTISGDGVTSSTISRA